MPEVAVRPHVRKFWYKRHQVAWRRFELRAAREYCQRRPCFICDQFRKCEHREAAIIDAEVERTWKTAKRV